MSVLIDGGGVRKHRDTLPGHARDRDHLDSRHDVHDRHAGGVGGAAAAAAAAKKAGLDKSGTLDRDGRATRPLSGTGTEKGRPGTAGAMARTGDRTAGHGSTGTHGAAAAPAAHEWEGGEVAVLSREDWNAIVDYFQAPDRTRRSGDRGGATENFVDYNRFCDAVLNPEEIKKVLEQWKAAAAREAAAAKAAAERGDKGGDRRVGGAGGGQGRGTTGALGTGPGRGGGGGGGKSGSYY